jgi:hypothetical protein
MPDDHDPIDTDDLPIDEDLEDLEEVVDDDAFGEDLDDDLEEDDDLETDDLDDDTVDDAVEVDDDEDDVSPKRDRPQAAEEEEGEEEDLDDEALDEDVEASLDEILKERLVVIDDDVEREEAPEADDRSDIASRVVPKQADEFVCQSCFLVKRMSQLADPEAMLCRDCV